MFLINKIGLLFAVGACIGWIIELFFRRFYSHKRWVNPGFLDGPYLPLYGVTTVVLFYLSSLPIPFEGRLLLFAFVPTLMELLTGLFFFKVYHIRLWDYSDRKGNYKGIICPTFTFFWMLLGLGFYLILQSRFIQLITWLSEHRDFTFFVGLFIGVFLVDLFSSFDAAAQIRKLLTQTEERFLLNYERLKLDVRVWMEERAVGSWRLRYLFPLKGRGRIELREAITRELGQLRSGQIGTQMIKRLLPKRGEDEQ